MGYLKRVLVWAMLLAFINLVIPAGTMAQSVKTGNLETGTYVQLGSYKGKPILWQVINNDQQGTVLFAQKILAFKSFDAKGDAAEGRDSKYNTRVNEGSNYWAKSNLREWLNSADAKVAYSHQKPDSQNTLDFGTEDLSYDSEPGFLSNFTDAERSAIQAVKHKTMLSSFDLQVKDGGSHLWGPEINNDNAYYQWVSDKVFLLSHNELMEWVKNHGLSVKAPWYTFKDKSVLDSYWLRCPDGNYAAAVFNVSGERIGSNTNAYRTLGVRPALYVEPDLTVSGNGTKDSPYIIAAGNTAIADTVQVKPAAAISQAITISINGKNLPSDVSPQIINSRTMVPLRAIFEALDIDVEWIPASKTVIGTKDNTRIQLTIDKTTALVNNQEVILDVPAAIVDSRTLVPVRFIGESTGQEVGWDDKTRTVAITPKAAAPSQIGSQGDSGVKEFYINQTGPIYLTVGQSKQISATVVGKNLSFEQEYPRWGTSNISIANISGDVVSGYTNTWGSETRRFIVTADKSVYVKALSPGQITLSASIGPYTANQSQTRDIIVIVKE
ncbi:MAG: stalk domain-containing protein [Syntrophomonadaceae bacterium]|nr:stalk domain-containing protein [Syntrophomonadaceae bacterium]